MILEGASLQTWRGSRDQLPVPKDLYFGAALQCFLLHDIIFLSCTVSYFCVYYVVCVVCVFLCRSSFSTLMLLVGSFDL